jgi:hypothetical protein
MNMNVLVLQKRMSLSNVKLPNVEQIDCQFIGVCLLTDEKNYTRYIDLHSKCKNSVLTNSLNDFIFKLPSEIRVFGVAQLTDRYCANLPQKSLTTT